MHSCHGLYDSFIKRNHLNPNFMLILDVPICTMLKFALNAHWTTMRSITCIKFFKWKKEKLFHDIIFWHLICKKLQCILFAIHFYIKFLYLDGIIKTISVKFNLSVKSETKRFVASYQFLLTQIRKHSPHVRSGI